VEANFNRKYHTEPFQGLVGKYAPLVAQIWLHAEKEVLLNRYAARQLDGTRHPGHVVKSDDDLELIGKALADGIWDPMDLGGSLFKVDTTDLSKIRYTDIMRQVLLTNNPWE
jgi:hypothetical protein